MPNESISRPASNSNEDATSVGDQDVVMEELNHPNEAVTGIDGSKILLLWNLLTKSHIIRMNTENRGR